MTSAVSTDANIAAIPSTYLKNAEILPMTNIRVERIISIADFKSKNIDFSTLRPALLINQTLLVKNKRTFS
jgi:hypothetical protein